MYVCLNVCLYVCVRVCVRECLRVCVRQEWSQAPRRLLEGTSSRAGMAQLCGRSVLDLPDMYS